MMNFDNNPELDKFYKRCRWAFKDDLEDTYCVNEASFHCTEFVGFKDDEYCKSCIHFFSAIDEENDRISDEQTYGLF